MERGFCGFGGLARIYFLDFFICDHLFDLGTVSLMKIASGESNI